jgi:hypothetical protein
VPAFAVVEDHRVLVGGDRVAGEDGDGAGGGEAVRPVGVDGHDVPVERARGGPADVEAPPAVGPAHQARPFQRLRPELVAAEDGQRLEHLAVDRPGDDVGEAAALADGPTEAVGEHDGAVVGQRGARPAGPVAGT